MMVRTKDASKFDDLRFRPFLIVEAYTKPSGNIRTEKKGWQAVKDSQKVSEVPSIVDRINRRTMCRAEVIIDIVNDTLLKNRLQGEESGVDAVTFGVEVLAHYKTKYASIIERGKTVWESRNQVMETA